MMRKFSLNIFFFSTLVATIFFDDPHLYFYKRIIYVIFMGLSLWQLYLFYFKSAPDEEALPMPAFFKPWMYLFTAFIAYNLFVDLRNPGFSLITELNHPIALLAVVPVFAFGMGYQTKDIKPFIRFLVVTAFLFILFTVVPLQGRNVSGPGLVCCYCVLPLTIFALYKKKYRLFALLLIGVSFVFSQIAESRTVILRIMIFFGLLIPLTVTRKWAPLKFLVICAMAFMIVQFLTNLETWLELFKAFVHVKNFDDEDTRTFLYTEIFDDLGVRDLIFGRGFQGTYFSPYFLWLQTNNNDFTGDFYYRFAVEVGFLQLLLKGGIIYFVLYMTPLVAAVYKGLFTRHTSRVAFLISVYIAAELLVMFVENIPAYHFQFFLIFFLAGYSFREASLHKSPVYEDLRYNALLQPGAVY